MNDHAAADILIVDDQPANLDVLSRLLRDSGYKVRAVTSGERALEAARHSVPECVLLDVSMPGMDGFATCHAFQVDPLLQNIPVIFLTAHDHTEHKLRGFQAGGRDYVTKPFEADEVLARVRNHLQIGRLERELRAQNAALNEANAKLVEAAEQKSRVTAMLVHDVRNPLTVIGAILDGDLDEGSLEDARLAYAGIRRLLDDMLELSKSDANPPPRSHVRVQLSDVVQRVVRLHQHIAVQHGIELICQSSGAQHLLDGDPEALDRAFSNLVCNALKFTPAGGKVELRIHEEAGTGVEAGLCFACVTVADSGEGIPPEELPFVFDPYRQGRFGAAHGGVGLGLAIVARIVAAHLGRVRVFSQLGVGTEFRVLFPV
jgi:two-component system, sensor histidine kinase and response regulator